MHEESLQPKYVSSVEAAELFGVTNDYLTQLCRKNLLKGVKTDRAWLVNPAEVESYLWHAQVRKELRRQELSQALQKEYQDVAPIFASAAVLAGASSGAFSLRASVTVFAAGIFLAAGIHASSALTAPLVRATSLPAAVAHIESPFFAPTFSYIGETFQKIASFFAPSTIAETEPKPAAPIASAAPTTTASIIAQTTPASAPVPTPAPEVSKPAAVTNVSNNYVTNTYPVVERVVERSVPGPAVDTSEFVTHSFLARQLDSIVTHMHSGSSGSSVSFADLTASDIPDLSGTYLSLSGGTVTGTTTTAGLAVSTLDCSPLGNGGKLTTDASGSVVCANDNGSGGVAWGSITGTLSAQSDLQSALNAKLNTSAFGQQFYGFFSATTTSALAEGSNLYYTPARFDNRLSATTSLPNITTLAGLSLPYSQVTGAPTQFAYPFPGNATSTQITFSGGLVGALTGNASTATALQTGRTINGVTFDGTANITVAAASSTLLGDSNTFAGTNTFSSTVIASIAGNAGTVTNGVYTTTFNSLFDPRFVSSLSATTSLPNILTLASLSLPYSQLTGTPSFFAYPFPSNATSTLIAFNGGLTASSATIAYASTTMLTASGSASTTALVVSNLNAASCDVKADTNGAFSCGIDATGGGSSFSYPFPSNATTTQIAFNGGLTAVGATTTALAVTGSSTISSVLNVGGLLNANGGVVGNLTGNADTVTNGVYTTTLNSLFDPRFVTNLAATTSVASITTLPGLLLSYAQLSGAPAIAAYPFGLVGNATSTLTQFNGGLTAYASTTIGAGGQATGLIVSGGATTTGNAYFASNIGIGVTAPGASLHVASNDSGEEILVGDDIWDANDSTNRILIGNTDGSSFLRFGQNTTNYSVFGWQYNASAGSSYLSILSNGGNNPIVLQRDGGNVGIGTTTPYAKLSVVGEVVAAYFTATTTTASSFNYASTTALSATSLCLLTDCRTIWPTAGSSFSYPFPSDATSTLLTFNGGVTLPVTAKLTAPYASTTNITATLASTTALNISGISSGLLKTINGAVTAASAGSDYENPLTFSGPLSRSVNAVSITQSGTGANGYLSSTDFNTFNNKISSSSLSGASVISYNSGTGVITTTPGTFASGDYTFTNKLTAPFASSTAITVSGTASTTALNISGISNSLLKTVNGVVTAAVAGTDYLTSATTFAYPFPNNATSTLIAFNGGLTTTNATSTNLFSGRLTSNTAAFGATATTTISSAGWLGIGVSAPLSPLQISQSQNTADSSYFNSRNVLTDSGGSSVGISKKGQYTSVTVSGTYALTSGFDSAAVDGESASATFSGTLDSGGNFSGLTVSGGNFAGAFNGTMSGSTDQLDILGVSTVAVGDIGTTGNTSHAGLYTTVSGTADNNYGMRVTSVSGATNNYGVYLDSVSAAAGNYALYSAAAAQSYLAGNLGVGTTTPGTALGVNGDSVLAGIVTGRYFIATSTLTASRFTYASTTAISGTIAQFTTASTTNLNISGISASLLKTVNGVVTAAVAGTDYLTAATTFAYPFPSNATSTLLTFSGGISVGGTLTVSGGRADYTASATSTIPNNVTYAWTIATSTTAKPLFRIDTTTGSEQVAIGSVGGDVTIGDVGSAANLVFEESSTIRGQTGGRTLTFGGTGDIINFAVKTGFGSTTPGTMLAVNGDSVLAGIVTGQYFLATSTLTASRFTYASTTMITASGSASTTALVISGLNAASCDVKASANGVLSCGTDSGSSFAYPFPSNATSTLLAFNGGLTAYASSTIGNGTLGLTISGGATTTGNHYIDGSLGIGVAPPSSPFSISTLLGIRSGDNLSTANGSATSPGLQFNADTNTGIFSGGNNTDTIAFSAGGVERARLTTTGFGIGTTTPGTTFAVNGDSVLAGIVTGQYFLATSTQNASIFTYASTTALTVLNSAYLASTKTSGALLTASAPSAVSVSSALTALNLDLRTNYTVSDANATGVSVDFANATGAIPGSNLTGFSAGTAGNTLSISNGGGFSNFFGMRSYNPNLTQTAGTANAAGVFVSTGTNTTGGNQFGLFVQGQGIAAGTLRGVYLPNITGGAGTETGIAVGSGWDTALDTEFVDILGTGAILSTATVANTLPYASTTMVTATTASTTNLIVSGLNAASCDVKASANGVLSCGTDATGGSSFSYPFPSNATSTLIAFNGGLTATNATSTSLFGGTLTANTAGFGATATSSFSSTGLFNLADQGSASSSLITLGNRQFLSASSSSLVANLFLGLDSGSKITTGGFNTALGYKALASATFGDSMVAIGYGALRSNVSGSGNIAIGYDALADSVSGTRNTAVGLLSLASSTASDNTAVGYQALQSDTTGGSNAAFGRLSLFGNRTGADNAAFGYRSSANNASATSTVAIGSDAARGPGAYFAQGYTAVGYSAGTAFTTGADYNTLVGYQAGSAITSGYANILFGASQTAGNLTTGNNNIGIGNNTFFPSATANNQLNIGGLLFGTLPATSSAFLLPTTGAIGIGTSSPFATLSIHANNGSTNPILFAIGSSTASATTTLFAVTNAGNVGVGITVPYGRLAVSSANLSQTWAQVGTAFSTTTVDAPSLAALSPTRIAFIDFTNDALTTYDWNGSTWAQVGTSFAIASVGTPILTALSPNRVAMVDSSTDTLRLYEFNGSSWSQLGSSLAVTSLSPGLVALSPNRVVFTDDASESLWVYEFNGSAWVQIGNPFSLASEGAPAMAAMSPSRIAHIDNLFDSLKMYEFNGTTWTQIGAGLSISHSGRAAMTALSQDRVAFLDATNGLLGVYEFNGQKWYQVGTSLALSSVSSPALAALSPNRVAFMDDNDILRTYQFSSPLLYVADSRDNNFLSVSDAGYTTAEAVGVRTSLTIGQSATSTAASSTPALIVNGTSLFQNNVGIGTSSPWAALSINPSASTSVPSLLVGSSTRTDFIVTQAGNVGIGTTSPARLLTVANALAILRLDRPSNANGTGYSLLEFSTAGTSKFLVGLNSDASAGAGADKLQIVDSAFSSTPVMTFTGGLIGIGSTTPGWLLALKAAVSTAQQAIAYDDTNFTQELTSSVGDAFYYQSGKDALFNDTNLWVCAGGSSNTNGCASGSPTGQGNAIIETKLGVNGTSTPFAAISIGANGSLVTTEKALSDGATVAIDWLNGNQQQVTLGGNRTITFANYIPGSTLRLVLCQDGTGSRTITWPNGATLMWPAGTAPTLTTTANKCDIMTFLATAGTSTVKVFGSSVLNY